MSVSGKMQIHCFINSESAAAAGIMPDMPLEEKLPLLDGMTLAGTRPRLVQLPSSRWTTSPAAASFLKRT